MSASSAHPPTTETAPRPQRPTGRQRRILTALARPGARIVAGAPHFITNCAGWLAWDIQPTNEDIRVLVHNGWIMERKGFAARTEWALTIAGREQVR